MEFKIATSESELLHLQENIAQVTGGNIPHTYYQHGKVMVCYNNEQEMLGGYVIISSPPFRSLYTLAHLPEAYISLFKQASLADILEMPALWIKQDVMSPREKAKFFQTLLLDVCSYNRSYLLYVYNYNRPELHKLYGRMKPKVLFQGQITAEFPKKPLGIDAVCLKELKQNIKKATSLKEGKFFKVDNPAQNEISIGSR
jgi:hypothetical protein